MRGSSGRARRATRQPPRCCAVVRLLSIIDAVAKRLIRFPLAYAPLMSSQRRAILCSQSLESTPSGETGSASAGARRRLASTPPAVKE